MAAVEVKVPKFPESVSEGTLSRWHKKAGDIVKSGEKIADIETDKIVIEVTAPADGVLVEVAQPEGATVKGEQRIGSVDTAAEPGTMRSGAPSTSAFEPAATPTMPPPSGDGSRPSPTMEPASPTPIPAPVPASTPAAPSPETPTLETPSSDKEWPFDIPEEEFSPAVRRLIKEHKLNPAEIAGHGKGGRITKADVLRHLEHSPHLSRAFGSGVPAAPPPAETPASTGSAPAEAAGPVPSADRPIARVKMSRLRQRVAERLVQAQRTAAILTTFNEINMQAVVDLRARYKEAFEKEHGVKLGFMSFFVKAAVEALARYPIINASVEGDEIVYHQYFDIGIAVSSPRGLVVPVLRNAERLSMADIERQINDFSARAREGKLTIEELSGGTFTISNGGVFGSLLSTPILNPPQSGILGLHRIQERPVAENGQVVIRPMMFVALSYDHRIIDGREAVLFLVAIKEAIEDPARLLLQI
ncbi:MAG: 2-oxoglutarate dehydrogenase complex dihydrolipoyllysine-residue succinyltransferase [Kiritimatiellae bacterium]|nr:2-oxoglutarate dehydrogenase complex dihydrolipoyllysine-residue succinyltransferase [Kiritimatiellia bacterium]MDW8457985.1 2-oxoglutarate dehydrogenase complex dihydrolipoyllysine-residue succinyltransferase [Verrucomicrobiota bacterium]